MESRDTNEALESTDRRDTEGQRLQEATAAPEALVEQGQTFQQAEAVEQELKRVVDTAAQAVTDEQISATPIPLPDPATAASGEIFATPIPLPDPAMAASGEISATPIPLPDPATAASGEISATPIPLPDPAMAASGEISATPIPLPDPVRAASGEISATPIPLPGEGGPVDWPHAPGEMPDPREFDIQLPQLSNQSQQQDQQDYLPSDFHDLFPQGGKIEGNEDPHSMLPAQEQELPGGFDPGMDFGSRENMNADAAPDKFETPPGIEGPFMPGKGPGAGMEMDEEKIGIFTKFQIEILNLIQTGDEAAIAKKEAEMQERALDIMEGDQAYQKEQEKLKDTGKAKPGGGTAQTGGQSQGSKPASGSKTPPAPPPKKGGAASDSETGRIRGYVAAESLGRMDQSTDDNLISQSSPDDIQPAGAEGGHLNAYGQVKMEASAHFREEIAGKKPDMKSEWITDPVEIEPGTQNMQAGKHAGKQES